MYDRLNSDTRYFVKAARKGVIKKPDEWKGTDDISKAQVYKSRGPTDTEFVIDFINEKVNDSAARIEEID